MRRSRHFGFLIVPVLFAAYAQADIPRSLESYLHGDWISLKANALMKAHSPEEVDKSLAQIESLKIERELCDVQLNSSRIPVSCFHLIRLEKEMGLLDLKKGGRSWREIDELCVHEVRKIKSLRDQDTHLKIPRSTVCRRELEMKVDKLRYGSLFRERPESVMLRHRF
jgi:hypothetical protein